VGVAVQSSAPHPTNTTANGTARKADGKGASVYFAHSPNRDDCHGTEEETIWS